MTADGAALYVSGTSLVADYTDGGARSPLANTGCTVGIVPGGSGYTGIMAGSSYIDWNTQIPIQGNATLTFRIKFVSAYTGSTQSTLMCSLGVLGTNANRIIWQVVNKYPSIQIFDVSGSSSVTYTFSQWSAEAQYTPYNLEWDMSSVTGVARFFINGMQYGSMLTGVNTLSGVWTIYNSLTCGGISGMVVFWISQMAVFPTVVHPTGANFTVIPMQVDGGCVSNTVSCDDGNFCSLDSCSILRGCIHTPLNCTIADKRYISSCNNATGCVYTPIDCDDGKACTVDTPDAILGCIYTPLFCTDHNFCSIDRCDNNTGCSFTFPPCVSHSACLVNGTCNPSTGLCSYHNSTCSNPNNKCMINGTCDPVYGCTFITKPCISPQACLVDGVCNPSTGACSYQHRVCEDFDPCTDNHCFNSSGCVFTTTDCDDHNPCTDQYCNSTGKGCTYIPHDCDDHDPCSIERCDPLTVDGCVYSDMNCSDGDNCTVDICELPGPSPPDTANCTHYPVSCYLAPNCLTDLCMAPSGVCTNGSVSCDDHDPSTRDQCLHGVGCVHIQPDCSTNNSCIIGRWTPIIGCQYFYVQCQSLGNACLVNGTCDPRTGQCVYANRTCIDNDPCTKNGLCDPRYGCNFTSIECDDDDVRLVCITRQCVDGACTHHALAGGTQCEADGNPCTVGVCGNFDSTCHESPVVGCIPCNESLGMEAGAEYCDALIGTGNPCQYAHCMYGRCVLMSIDRPVPCEVDGIQCTIGHCMPYMGMCHEILDPSCVPCQNDSTCNDHDSCSWDWCETDPTVIEGAPRCMHHTGPNTCAVVAGCPDCDDHNECSWDVLLNAENCTCGHVDISYHCSAASLGLVPDPCTTYGCNETIGCYAVMNPGCRVDHRTAIIISAVLGGVIGIIALGVLIGMCVLYIRPPSKTLSPPLTNHDSSSNTASDGSEDNDEYSLATMAHLKKQQKWRRPKYDELS
jgi:Dictyostelium (slime mold) repeat